MARVLVVEDDEAIRIACRRHLTEAAHAVATAARGRPAWSRVQRRTRGRSLLDLGLDVDGIALISIIRATCGVPFIVITAQDDPPTMVEALDDGADDYIIFPRNRAGVTRFRAMVPGACGRSSARGRSRSGWASGHRRTRPRRWPR